MTTEMMEPVRLNIAHWRLVDCLYLTWEALAWETSLLYWEHHQLMMHEAPMAAWQRREQAKTLQHGPVKRPESFCTKLLLPIPNAFLLISLRTFSTLFF